MPSFHEKLASALSKEASDRRVRLLEMLAPFIKNDKLKVFRGSTDIASIDRAASSSLRELKQILRSYKDTGASKPQQKLLYDAIKGSTDFGPAKKPVLHTTTNPWVAHRFKGDSLSSGVATYEIPVEDIMKGRTIRLPSKDFNLPYEYGLEDEISMLGNIGKYRTRLTTQKLPEYTNSALSYYGNYLARKLNEAGIDPNSLAERTDEVLPLYKRTMKDFFEERAQQSPGPTALFHDDKHRRQHGFLD